MQKNIKIHFITVSLVILMIFMEGIAIAEQATFKDIKTNMIMKQVIDMLGKPNDEKITIGKQPNFLALMCIFGMFQKVGASEKILYYKGQGRIYLKETEELTYIKHWTKKAQTYKTEKVLEDYRVVRIEEDSTEDGYR